MKQRMSAISRGTVILAGMGLLILVIAVISIHSGKMNVSPQEVWHVLLGQGTDKQNLIIFTFRLPRIVLSLLVGVGMGAAGCIMQTLLRNDMASPGTLGISSGSGLFVLLFVTFFSTYGLSSAVLLPVLSFVGGLTAAAIIYLLSIRSGRDLSPTGLILNGVALATGYSAVTLLLTLRLDERQMDFMLRWSAGDLWGDDWRYLAILAPWTIILCTYIFYKSRVLNAILLGAQTAKGLGLAMKPEFLGLSLAAVALSSGSVALGGNFFFVGLIAPHLARRLTGHNHKLLLPCTCLAGAILVLAADTITRTISFGTDMPTGIVITLLSTPYFLYLLARSN
ncbi:iron ABC transporter permease [Paenibacillus sp. IB182496]|uniref:Iron ABC transporter permease n=1 Tax=Paenibacillus sabuli TaxID=2772509 RepID=A0A927BVM3_9BACL|nr:iron ABC transporter permease [Paenibacillus sabuli]MBD2846575.1 iron ABC transporter permease [Paenibacillus sabuli]